MPIVNLGLARLCADNLLRIVDKTFPGLPVTMRDASISTKALPLPPAARARQYYAGASHRAMISSDVGVSQASAMRARPSWFCRLLPPGTQSLATTA